MEKAQIENFFEDDSGKSVNRDHKKYPQKLLAKSINKEHVQNGWVTGKLSRRTNRLAAISGFYEMSIGR